MKAITPIMLGINSRKMSKEQAKLEGDDATILDVDSSSLYSADASLLCECCMKEIFSKLQLAKVYYSVNPERLYTYGMESLEQNVDDQEFVTNARKLMLMKDGINKEKAFVSLVRKTFFDFFKKIANYKDFMEYNSKENEYVFISERFIEQITKCGRTECTMPKF